jgi:hypothetical protein
MATTGNCGLVVVAVLALAPVPGLAAEESPDAMQDCRAETDNARRLSCYDRVIDARSEHAAPKAAAPAAVVRPAAPVAATPVAATPVTPQEKFGYSDVRDREEREAEAKDPERLEELIAVVSEVTKRPNGTHVITLDNGQVWVERNLDPFFRVKAGETVRIRPAALGSFLLSTPSNHSTRVSRQK